MSTTKTITARIQQYRDTATQAKSAYRRIVDATNSDSTRTSGWKKEQVREARNNLARELERLEGEERQYLDTTIKDLERSVYGIPTGSDVLAYRDAQDRVAALHYSEETAALDLYRQAERTGDSTLKQALSHRAVDAGWAQVQATHVAAHPDQGDKLEALDAVQRFTQSYTDGIHTGVDYSMPMN